MESIFQIVTDNSIPLHHRINRSYATWHSMPSEHRNAMAYFCMYSPVEAVHQEIKSMADLDLQRRGQTMDTASFGVAESVIAEQCTMTQADVENLSVTYSQGDVKELSSLAAFAARLLPSRPPAAARRSAACAHADRRCHHLHYTNLSATRYGVCILGDIFQTGLHATTHATLARYRTPPL